MIEIIEFSLKFIIEDLFIGFGLSSIILTIFYYAIPNNYFIKVVKKTSYQLISLIGIIYLSLIIIHTILSIVLLTDFERYAVINRMFGPYFYFFWLNIIFYVVITQLFRLESIRKSTLLILFLSLMFIFSDQIFNLITYLHLMLYQNNWLMLRKDNYIAAEMIVGFLIKILAYSVCVFLFSLITERLKKFSFALNKNKNERLSA